MGVVQGGAFKVFKILSYYLKYLWKFAQTTFFYFSSPNLLGWVFTDVIFFIVSLYSKCVLDYLFLPHLVE